MFCAVVVAVSISSGDIIVEEVHQGGWWCGL